MELLINFIKAACLLFGPFLFLILMVVSPLIGIALFMTAGLTYFITKN
jgi:hypothetical protein